MRLLVLSIFLHACLAWFIWTKLETPDRRSFKPVHLQIIPSQKKNLSFGTGESKRRLEGTVTQEQWAQPRLKNPQGHPAEDSKNSKTKFWQSMLPQVRELSETQTKYVSEGQQISDVGGAPGKVNGDPRSVPLDLQILAEIFEIPLRLRKVMKHESAKIHLRRQDACFTIVSLVGNPYLRASLYRGLEKPDSLGKIRKVMENFGALKEILIELDSHVGPKAGGGEHFMDKVFWQPPKFLIQKEIAENVTFGSSEDGVLIDDEDAKKARRRDQVEVKKLEESIAFVMPLRNESQCL